MRCVRSMLLAASPCVSSPCAPVHTTDLVHDEACRDNLAGKLNAYILASFSYIFSVHLAIQRKDLLFQKPCQLFYTVKKNRIEI